MTDPSAPPPKKARTSLVTLRGPRLTLRQRAVGWDRTMPVLKAVLAFQAFLSEAGPSIDAVPEAHLPLIASLAQESDKSAPELAKAIKAMLAPEGSADSLALSVIQNAIDTVAERRNYGIDAPDGAEVPPSLQLWRWEARDDALLPDEHREKLRARRDERVRAKDEAREQFEALPKDAQEALLQGKKAPRPAAPAPETPSRGSMREARRAERQAREDKVEKGRQAQASMFNSFFQRGTGKTADEAPKTDFEAVFLPAEYKNVAPINRFYSPSRIQPPTPQPDRSAADLLGEFKRTYGPSTRAARLRRGIHAPVCVRDVMQVVRESDVLGGNAEEQAKRGLERLNNRRLVPLKLLQFQTDRRPGWLGTWTRSTNLISARCPFGQDPMALDYNYDSDAEWEEGDDGEIVEGVDDREDEEESMVPSESDSEMDDWLEDDLEEAGDADEGVVDEHDAQHTRTGEKRKKKVKWLGRRFDSKLVPYIAGPFFEHTLGTPTHEPFEPYRIVFLNAPPGADPFTFVPEAAPESAPPATSAAPATSTSAPSSSAPPSSEATPDAPPRPAKSSFPDTHIAELLERIEGSTRPKPVLLEELREHFAPHIKGVSKASIETRLNECAMRESKKPGARWIIREEHRAKMSR